MTFSERAVEAGLKAYNNAIDDLSEDTIRMLYSLDDIRRHGLTAALTAALAMDGLVVVPEEPTPKIIKAYITADRRRKRYAATAKRDWTAMLTAASDGEVG